MKIKKAELNNEMKKQIEDEFAGHEAKNSVACRFTPFSFIAKENDEFVGAVTGFTCYAEVYIDELVVLEAHRGKGIGTRLLEAVENYYRGDGYNNMNLCTNEFQAPEFYEKLGFELEFVRENKCNPKLNKYFYVKFFKEI